MAVSKEKVVKALIECSNRIIENKEYLNELDRPIGDFDHGVNMARGFTLVLDKMDSIKDKTISEILNNVAMTLISNVGGASGPLYGTAFLKAAIVTKGKESLDGKDFVDIYEAVIEGIKMRGKSDKGCKTMLDSIIPAYEAFKASIENGGNIHEAAVLATKAAEEGIEYTKTIIATRGRASYLGERSIGHQDPGATSSTIIIKVFSESMNN